LNGREIEPVRIGVRGSSCFALRWFSFSNTDRIDRRLPLSAVLVTAGGSALSASEAEIEPIDKELERDTCRALGL